MRAVWNGMTLARSDRTIIVEGNHYFPLEDVNREYLSTSTRVSVCPWKGFARYYSIEAGGKRNPGAAWYYPQPLPWIRKIKGHVAFWQGVDVLP